MAGVFFFGEEPQELCIISNMPPEVRLLLYDLPVCTSVKVEGECMMLPSTSQPVLGRCLRVLVCKRLPPASGAGGIGGSSCSAWQWLAGGSVGPTSARLLTPPALCNCRLPGR